MSPKASVHLKKVDKFVYLNVERIDEAPNQKVAGGFQKSRDVSGCYCQCHGQHNYRIVSLPREALVRSFVFNERSWQPDSQRRKRCQGYDSLPSHMTLHQNKTSTMVPLHTDLLFPFWLPSLLTWTIARQQTGSILSAAFVYIGPSVNQMLDIRFRKKYNTVTRTVTQTHTYMYV